MGRNRKPENLKLLEGTYRADRDNGEVAAELLAEMPQAPKDLKKRGKDEWNVVCRWLFQRDILATTDLTLVAMYCNEVDRYWDLERMIRKCEKIINSKKKYPQQPPIPLVYPGMDQEDKLLAKMKHKEQIAYWDRECRNVDREYAQAQELHSEYIRLQGGSKRAALVYATQFGFTPASRARVGTGGGPPKKKSVAEMLAGLKEG